MGVVGKMLFGPDDVADAHLPVVDDPGEDEERVPVRLRHHEVLDRRIGKTDLPANQVLDHGHAFVGNLETQGAPDPALEPPVAAEAVVAGDGVRLRPLEDHLPGAVARVQKAVAPKLLESGLVMLPALGLTIGALVPVDAEPRQGGADPLDPLLLVPLRVGVFDPQDERACVTPREAPVVERGAGPADVEVAGRRRGYADADRPRPARWKVWVEHHQARLPVAEPRPSAPDERDRQRGAFRDGAEGRSR